VSLTENMLYGINTFVTRRFRNIHIKN